MGMLPFLIAGLAALAVLVIAVGIAMSGGSGGVAVAPRALRRRAGRTTAHGTSDRDSVVIAGLEPRDRGAGPCRPASRPRSPART